MPRRVTEVLAEAVVLYQPEKRVTGVLVEAVVRYQTEKRVTEILVEIVRSVADQPAMVDEDPIVMVVS